VGDEEDDARMVEGVGKDEQVRKAVATQKTRKTIGARPA
jgi:hypothetical protein